MCNICHGLGCPCCEETPPPCPHCNGEGKIYLRYNPFADDYHPVSYEVYQSLPVEEQYNETCYHCDGSGQSQEDPVETHWDTQTLQYYYAHD